LLVRQLLTADDSNVAYNFNALKLGVP